MSIFEILTISGGAERPHRCRRHHLSAEGAYFAHSNYDCTIKSHFTDQKTDQKLREKTVLTIIKPK